MNPAILAARFAPLAQVTARSRGNRFRACRSVASQ